MEIIQNRKEEKVTLVRELAVGETFIFLNSEYFDKSDVFMKGDMGVVNLRTGYIYQNVSLYEVELVKAKLIIE